MTTEKLKQILALHELWIYNDNQGIRADFTGADLEEANLRGADLRGADLEEADLTGANLRGAGLRGAYLEWARGIKLFKSMPTSGRTVYAVAGDSWMIKAGCFWGTLDELENRVLSSHKCPVYLKIIKELRAEAN